MSMTSAVQNAMPARKRLNHRGPLSIDVPSAWYFITICAANHAPRVGSRVPRDALRAKLLPQIYSFGFLNPDVEYFKQCHT